MLAQDIYQVDSASERTKVEQGRGLKVHRMASSIDSGTDRAVPEDG